MQTLEFEHKFIYGKHYYYPLNDDAKKMLHLVNSHGRRKAFTDEQVTTLFEFGFVIKTKHKHDDILWTRG